MTGDLGYESFLALSAAPVPIHTNGVPSHRRSASGSNRSNRGRASLQQYRRFLTEVPALLKLAEKTVYAMAQADEMPEFKIRGQWRIKRAELDQWIAAQPRGGDGGGRGE